MAGQHCRRNLLHCSHVLQLSVIMKWNLLFETRFFWGPVNKEQSQIRSLEHPPQCLVGDSHKRHLWRERGSDTDLLSSQSNRELGLWRMPWWLAPPSVVMNELHCLCITAEIYSSALKPLARRLLARNVMSLVRTERSEPRSCGSLFSLPSHRVINFDGGVKKY
jgi:hypothetical protein